MAARLYLHPHFPSLRSLFPFPSEPLPDVDPIGRKLKRWSAGVVVEEVVVQTEGERPAPGVANPLRVLDLMEQVYLSIDDFRGDLAPVLSPETGRVARGRAIGGRRRERRRLRSPGAPCPPVPHSEAVLVGAWERGQTTMVR